MKRKYPFCVGPESDEKQVREAVAGLRRMVAYGQAAAKALAALKTEGCYDKRIPIVTDPVSHYGSGKIDLARFPRFVTVSRDDVPGYGPLDISFGTITKGFHGGAEPEEIQIMLRCTGWDPANEWKVRKIHIGNARFKKNGEIVFVEQHDGRAKGVYKLYMSPQTDAAILAYEYIGKSIAHNIVAFSEYDLRGDRVSQPIQDIRAGLGKWLVEDGHILDFCRHIRGNALAATVMQA